MGYMSLPMEAGKYLAVAAVPGLCGRQGHGAGGGRHALADLVHVADCDCNAPLCLQVRRRTGARDCHACISNGHFMHNDCIACTVTTS